MAKNKSRFIYLYIVIIVSISQYNCFANESPFDFNHRLKIYKETRRLVNFKEIKKTNSGQKVDEVINWTKLYKYEDKPYCGATIQFCLEKAGYKKPNDVIYPLRARGWFKSNIIYNRGHWIGFYKQKPRLCDLVGFIFDGSNINHVGFFLWSLKKLEFKTFEGNTSQPGNKSVEGFFDKKRTFSNNIVIRKLDFK